MEIGYYVTASGVDIFAEWMKSLTDLTAKIAIDRRLTRLEIGNPSDSKSVGNGVRELRIDVGPGYPGYYAKVGLTIVLIMGDGDKKSQALDIAAAVAALADWKRRSA